MEGLRATKNTNFGIFYFAKKVKDTVGAWLLVEQKGIHERL
jgi:hypothetical protein